MDLFFTPEQEAIRDAIARICADFDADYWRKIDKEERFPEEFAQAIAKAGWLGIAMPPELGGAGLGITETAIMAETIGASGACASGFSAVMPNVFGLHPVVIAGTKEQQQRMLPPLIQRKDVACFGVTEPNTGLDTTRLKTRAELDKEGKVYIVNGQKIWTTTAQESNKILLIARTKPIEETKRPIDGLTLFYTNLDRKYCEVRRIPKMGRAAVDSNMIFFENLPVPVEDRIGAEGEGFKLLLHGLNPERIQIAAGVCGSARAALNRAVKYANERVVFNRPIGMNQAIQHPLADSWCKLEAARLMTYKAAMLYDRKLPCGPEASAAKYLAAECNFETAERAVLTHGGMGYAKEFHVERYLRESFIHKLGPVSHELILCYIAEKVLGLPKSY